jgi:hypothetical protein
VHGRIQRRQQARWAAQDQADAAAAPAPPAQYAAPALARQAYAEPAPPPQAPATPPPSAGTNDRLAQLKQLGDLLSAGVLTQAEFEHEKARILNG